MKPTSGTITYDGKDIWQDGYPLKELRSKVGLVFQYPEYQLFEESVFKDVCFGPKNQGLIEDEVKARATEALKMVGIDESLYEASPFELSGGQKRRVAIAGVLAMNPQILILDEPTAGLDPKGRDDILGQIAKLQKERGITIVLVSHSMEDVAQYASRILVVNGGKIVFDDKPRKVFEHEKESLGSSDSEKLKLKTIADIKNAGFEVEKIIINSNLTEEEAFAAEASLINAFNYVGDAGLTNIVAGHHSAEALSVDEYERINGAAPLEEKDIRHKILVIKINRLYQRGMDEKVLYDAVRGVWRVSKEKVRTVEYVFGVYNSLIVAVYKPSEWFVCKEAKDRLPRQDIVLTPKTENRLFFVDERYEQGFSLDENESFYIGKSIARLKLNQSAQNPITYLYPLEKDKIHIQ